MSINGRIQLLPPELCNQIAAGEVVERPASVLKELVENSLDAGAKQIDVRLDNGGQSLVRVQDDGQGIASAELELAVTRHATSKISRLEDMDSIGTYGFRGEALPSIASVSIFTITSRRASDPPGVGQRLTVEHGRRISLEQAALRCGTVVEARDLFANMPGRLRFLKQPASEFKRAQGWFVRLAIACLEAGFTLAAGDRQVMRFQKGESLRERLRHVWPTEIVDQMLPLNSEMHGINITGLVGPPQLQQPKADRIFFYVNGRSVNDKRLLAAVREAYRGRLVTRDYPQLAMFIDINPEEVDVNAHPAKTEVRFRNEAAIFSAVYGALGLAFQQNEPVRPVAPHAPVAPPPGVWGDLDADDKVRMPPPLSSHNAGLSWEVETPAEMSSLAEAVAPYRTAPPVVSAVDPIPCKDPFGHRVAMERPPDDADSGKSIGGEIAYLGQIANTYLVLNENDSLVLIDQHAAHERILYHRYEHGFMQGNGQKLMIPLEFTLDAGGDEILKQMGHHLKRLGFEFQEDQGKLLVHVISPSLTRSSARDFLKDVLSGCSCRIQDVWISMACHAAIKAGQPLARDEALELIAAWRNTPQRDFCPHGRPCVLRWNESSLERLFKRR